MSICFFHACTCMQEAPVTTNITTRNTVPLLTVGMNDTIASAFSDHVQYAIIEHCYLHCIPLGAISIGALVAHDSVNLIVVQLC